MGEWWTYRPSDFLMFSAPSWGRLVEGFNRELWPWQAVLLLAGLVLLALAWRAPERGRRVVLLALAAAWAGVGWAFHWQRFSEINTAAIGFAWAFGAQAVLLVLAAAAPPAERAPSPFARMTGQALAWAALVAYPVLGPALRGTGAWQAEFAGATPDPTALFTIGLLLALPVRRRVPLLVLPAAWAVIAATTAWLLHAG
jgi:hypothetical protein